MAWPFRHNWSSPYLVTYSYLTSIITSDQGYEQRIAERDEPRRTITTSVLVDEDGARSLDRFIWSTQADAFAHVSPVTGQSSSVRLPQDMPVDHPNGTVAVATVALSVEPGTDTYDDPLLDAGSSYAGRYVFPYTVNWREGVPNTFSLPRQTIDYGGGRIAVAQPIPFAARSGTFNLVFTDNAVPLIDFFRSMRGRQGEFWLPSTLDDFRVTSTTTSDRLRVAGSDAYDMWRRDSVNAGIVLQMVHGSRYYRRVVDASLVGADSVLVFDREVPDIVSPTAVRRAAWLRVARFASDDLTIEWRTSTTAISQVQAVTLPYAASETVTGLDDLIDYFGYGFFAGLFGDLLDYIVNVEAPLIDDVMNRSELAFQFGPPLAYVVNVSAPKNEEYP